MKSNKGIKSVPAKKIKNELTEEQRQEIKEAFDLYDTYGVGKIEAKELKTALRALGYDGKKDEIKRITNEIEKFGEKGSVNYEQFMEIMGLKSVERDPTEEMRKAVHLICAEGDDNIDVDSLSKIAKELGENISPEELAEMIAEADRDEDGKVNEDDFVKIMKKTNLF